MFKKYLINKQVSVIIKSVYRKGRNYGKILKKLTVFLSGLLIVTTVFDLCYSPLI